MGGRAWSDNEREQLRLMASEGAFTIGKVIGRSERAVESEALRMGVSLAGDPLKPRQSAEQHVKRITERIGAPLCPQCGKRPAIMKRDGICRVCYLDNLIEQREAELTERLVQAKRASKSAAGDSA